MNEEKLKIIQHSQQRFYNEGFYKITIEELARDLRISKNTIYKHFKNKDDLLMASISELIKFVNTNVSTLINSNSNSVEKLINLLRLITQTLMKIDGKFLSDIRVYRPDLWEYMDNQRKILMHKNISKLIIQGKSEGLIIDLPDEIIIEMTITSLRSIVNPEFLLRVNHSMADVVEYGFDFVSNAILTTKGKNIFKKLRLKK